MKQDGERKEALFRILVFIISGIIIYLWRYLAMILSLFNWLSALIFNKRSKAIGEFVEYWNTEAYKFTRYISGVRNDRPFPFSNLERMSKFE